MKLRKDEAQFRRQRIVELKQRDKSLTNLQIAERLGTDQDTVRYIWNRYGLTNSPPEKK